MVPGGLCAVVMAGICRMPQWCVVNWAMAKLELHLGRLLLEREGVQFGIPMCAAMAVKPPSLSVPIVVLECNSIATVKMLEWSVQVSEVASGVRCVLRGRRQQSEDQCTLSDSHGITT